MRGGQPSAPWAWALGELLAGFAGKIVPRKLHLGDIVGIKRVNKRYQHTMSLIVFQRLNTVHANLPRGIVRKVIYQRIYRDGVVDIS